MRRTALLYLATIVTAVAQAPLAPVRIILVGDSTVAPVNGWGPGFCADVVPQVTCINMAKNGRAPAAIERRVPGLR